MSLINDMLKDLEQRRAEQPVAQDDSLKGLKAVKDKSKQKRPGRSRMIVFLLILVIIGLVLYFLYQSRIIKTNEVEKGKQIPSAEVSRLVNGVVSEEALKPDIIMLNAMTVIQSDSQVLLQLSLTQPVHYQLHVSDDHQTLMLTLAHTKLAEPLPPIQNDIIQGYQITESEDHLLLTLKVVPQTEVRGLEMSEQAPFTLNLILAPMKLEEAGQEVKEEPVMTKTEVISSAQQLADQRYQTALAFINQNDFKQAEIKLHESLEVLPSFMPARTTLITILINQNRYHLADQFLKEGLQYAPDSVDLIKLYAQMCIRQGQLHKALMMLQRVSPTLAEDPEYYALLAALRQRLGQPLLAAQLYEQLLNYDAGNGIWWMGLGIALESAGKQNAALNAYRRAIETGDLRPDVHGYIKSKISQGS